MVLGQPVQELQRVARETLEGGLRAVIGKMTPEEIVEDRDKFVSTVMNEGNVPVLLKELLSIRVSSLNACRY